MGTFLRRNVCFCEWGALRTVLGWAFCFLWTEAGAGTFHTRQTCMWLNPGSVQKPVSWILASLFPFCFRSRRQNAARTVSNLVSGRAGEKTLLSNDCTGACGLLLSASTLLPLSWQLILIAHFSNHRYRSKAFRGFSCITQRAELGLLAGCSPCSAEFLFLKSRTEGTDSLLLRNRGW